MSELSDCPFCGNSDMDEDEGVYPRGPRLPDGTMVPGHFFIVRCGNPSCNAEVEDETREKAVARWNRRVQLVAMRTCLQTGTAECAIAMAQRIIGDPRDSVSGGG